MKKSILALAISSLTSLSVCAEVLNGELQGVSGAAYATGNFAQGVILNPSQLASESPNNGGFGALLGLGVLVSDADDLIDQADDLTGLTDQIRASSNLSTSQATELKKRLGDISGDSAYLSAGGNFVLAFATKESFSAALVVNSYSQLSVTPNVAQSDLALIDSYVNKKFDPSNNVTGLKSTINTRGAVVADVGIAIAKSFAIDESRRLQIGVTPKRTQVDAVLYNAKVADYDDSDWDADNYKTSGSTVNLDVGALYVHDNYRAGLTIQNLKNQRYETSINGEHVDINRQLNASAGYVKDGLKAEVALDLNAVPAIGLNGDSQFLRAGVDYTVLKFVHLRGGLQQDLKSTQDNTYSIGLGLGSAFNLAYITGGERSKGVALSGGFRF